MSYRKIFTVVNEHTVSTVTARYAIALAAACKAELVLYAAHDEKCSEAILRNTDRHLDHLFTAAFAQEILMTRITEIGDIRKMLPKRVKADKADLVLYPLTPDERYGASLQRHTVHHLLRSISSDLAIIRAISMAKPHPARILVPLRKIISSKVRRLKFISELALSFHSEVTLFHLPETGRWKGPADEISHFRMELQKLDVKVQERSGRGEIGKAITVEAITRHNDLIVLGASERGVLRRLFIGNPAADVMHHPPCNTILFKAAS